ncbi:MAG TPA: RNA polymerase sigma factor [Kiritimatiellia bacterium]|nr:RNA polymerase sigma factor [Kiritimatiellia bacterium]HMO98360.1 RNA polymerase sigma factor [Kiritimatiellia bacterium]HMP97955.1 RNA polymerase sigma factor [Kiritimatiellia bacterium]
MATDEDSQQEWTWLQQAAGGDETAFRSLVERYQGRLMNFFLRHGVKDHAEDLVQETFMRLYRHRRHARPLARFTTFIHTLAHHAWVDFVRKQNRRARLLACFGRESTAIDSQSAQCASDRIDAECLLQTLTPDHRAAVILILYQGLSHAEAAEALGIPVGTVKSRLHHALHRMHNVLHAPKGIDHE